ncbi:hypothetical protein [uncultured Marinobacter sp.]
MSGSETGLVPEPRTGASNRKDQLQMVTAKAPWKSRTFSHVLASQGNP